MAKPNMSESSTQAKVGFVDILATITGTALLVLAFGQLLMPAASQPLSGIEPGIPGQILAVLWAVFGALLLIGGFTRLRVLTIFSGEFVTIVSLATLAVIMVHQPDIIALIIHGGLAALAFVSGGFARLSDKAEIKRELRLMQESVKLNAQTAPTPVKPAKPISDESRY